METAEIMAPGDVKKFHPVAVKRACVWSVVDCDPRTQDPRLVVDAALCRLYQKDRCECGDECKYRTRRLEGTP